MRLAKLAESLSVESIRKLLKLKRNLGQARAMEKRRDNLLKEAARLEKAIAKLQESGMAPAKARPKRKRFSAAVRKKMATAQKRRWAKIRKQKKGKTAQARKRERKVAVETTTTAGATS